ncbi:hypothetical protein HBI63_230350 [Parastagonospora nodorum]|nr:hypothetical protein HBI63_230350 [Parastagonospora nodorum]
MRMLVRQLIAALTSRRVLRTSSNTIYQRGASQAQRGAKQNKVFSFIRSLSKATTTGALTLPRAKFCLYHRQLIDIQRTNDILPESQKHEYEYSPVPADTVLLPISPNLMMHFFLHLDEAALRSVPL